MKLYGEKAGLVQLVDTQEWGSCQWGFKSLIPHHWNFESGVMTRKPKLAERKAV